MSAFGTSRATSLMNDSSEGTDRKRLDVPPRIVKDRHVGVTEGVDGLLAIADDEDRGGDRTGGGKTGAFAPGLHQQRDQLPLRAARVLEFVDEHVVIARLEAVAALT